LLAPRKRKPRAPAGKRRHSPVERLHFAKPWDPEARGGRGGWKPFIRATMGKSGAYAIRHSGGTYVGSSNAGRLYRTMVRHLEEWGRDKDFWAEAENRTHGAPGETFDREAVEVAVIRCPADQAHALEAELIQRLRSATNEQSPPGEPVAKLTDEVPF